MTWPAHCEMGRPATAGQADGAMLVAGCGCLACTTTAGAAGAGAGTGTGGGSGAGVPAQTLAQPLKL